MTAIVIHRSASYFCTAYAGHHGVSLDLSLSHHRKTHGPGLVPVERGSVAHGDRGAVSGVGGNGAEVAAHCC